MAACSDQPSSSPPAGGSSGQAGATTRGGTGANAGGSATSTGGAPVGNAAGGTATSGATSGGAFATSGGSGGSQAGAGGDARAGSSGAEGGATGAGKGGSTNAGGANNAGGSAATGGANTGGSAVAGATSGGASGNGDRCTAQAVGAGDMHTCALAGDGSVFCWGSNAQKQVGMGAASKQLTPLEVTAAGKDNVELLVGHHASCVKKRDGSVQCWGTLDDVATFQNVVAPRALTAFGTDFSEMLVDTSVCVRRASDRSVACWGYEDTNLTTITAFGTDVVDIDLEFRTVCAVKGTGSVMCRTDRDAPRALSGVSDAVRVGLRRDHDGLAEPEDVMVVGADGRGWYSHNGAALRAMNLGGQKVATYNAQHHLIGATSTNGRVMMWHSAICGGFGDNNPPDDNGSTAGDRRNYTSAPAVPTGFDMGASGEVALGHEHACVIRAADSSVYCWGRNVEGQIGNGKTARECTVGAGSNPGPDGNQMTPYRVSWCP